ncbi:hypothetical protein ACFW93_38085 [Streptomyces canus]|uniref:hypothetical protein n=1 Tax=Streptomyces canus TaxID=58343 RepID=UPI0036B4DFD9
MLTSRSHQRTRQHLADVPFDGPVEVGRLKKRSAWAEVLGSRRSFTEHTDQVLPRARLTARLKDAILNAVSDEVRAIDHSGGQFGVSWPSLPGPGASMSTSSADFVALAADEVIDVVDGRDAAAVAAWPAAQPRWRRRRAQVVAIDPSASFHSAICRCSARPCECAPLSIGQAW